LEIQTFVAQVSVLAVFETTLKGGFEILGFQPFF
jgi:hypothetical protein